MTVVRPNQTGIANAQTVGRVAGGAASVPSHLAGLVAAHPKLADHYKNDPGLRAFLDKNAGNLVGAPPAGAAADTVTWETWCHATTNVPVKERDEEYVIVVARGSAYQAAGDIQIPLQNGKTATSDGRIVFVAKTSDLLGTQKKADENGSYPGAITVDVTVPVVGKPGETLSLAYCRVRPNPSGAMHPHHSGWPDSFDGVFGGYSGRELDMKLAGGRKQFVESVDGCSTRSSAKLV